MEAPSFQHFELARVTINPFNLTLLFIYDESEVEADLYGAR
jgi:hypothetical protein